MAGREFACPQQTTWTSGRKSPLGLENWFFPARRFIESRVDHPSATSGWISRHPLRSGVR